MATPQLQWTQQMDAGISSNATSNSPSITTDASGNSYLVFCTVGAVSGGLNFGGLDIVVSKIDSNGAFLWTKQHAAVNTTNNDVVPKIAVDVNGNAYIVYKTFGIVSGGVNMGYSDIVVFKLNAFGQIQWVKQQTDYNTIYDNTDPSISVDTNGNVYVSHATDGTVSGGTNTGAHDIVVFKMNTNGQLQWVKEQPVMSTNADDLNTYIDTDTSGNVYVMYQTRGTVSGGTFVGAANFNVAIFKMDTNGDLVWIKQDMPINSDNESMNPSMCVHGSGNIYLTYDVHGTVSGGTNIGEGDIVVIKLNSSGQVQWLQQQPLMNTLTNDVIPRISVDNSGNVGVIYQTFGGIVSGGTVQDYVNLVVFKMDSSGQVVWIKEDMELNTNNYEETPTIAFDSNGDICVAYTTYAVINGGLYGYDHQNIAVVKLNGTTGIRQWFQAQVNINSPNGGYESSIAVDNNGNTYIAYQTNASISGGVNSGYNDVVIRKMNPNGTTAWIKQHATMNTNRDDITPSIVTDTAGNIYLSYSTYGTVSGGTNIGNSDIAVVKMDTNGSIVWIKQVATINTDWYEDMPSMAYSASGHIYLTYPTGPPLSGATPTGDFDIAVIKMDTNGNVVWTKQNPSFNTYSRDMTPKIASDSAGNAYVVYTSQGSASGGISTGPANIVVFKLSSAGDVQWLKQTEAMNSNNWNEDPLIKLDNSGNVYVAYNAWGSVSGGQNSGASDMIVFKLNSTGDLQWIKQSPVLNTNQWDGQPSMDVDNSGNIYVSHSTNGTVSGSTISGGQTYIVMAKMDTNGNIVWILENTDINVSYNNYSSRILTKGGDIYLSVGTTQYLSGPNGSNSSAGIIYAFKYSDAAGAPPSTPYCLAKGTQILTPQGYTLIETLHKGDLVVTGDKRIVAIESIHTTFFSKTTKQNAPYIIERDAFGKNCPPNALEVSGKHSVQIAEGLWEIPEEAAKSNRLVKQASLGESVSYYHIALPDYAKDTLVANGQIVDSLNKGRYIESYTWNSVKQGYVRKLTPNTIKKFLYLS